MRRSRQDYYYRVTFQVTLVVSEKKWGHCYGFYDTDNYIC